jgi:dipeptidyl-peptidase-3
VPPLVNPSQKNPRSPPPQYADIKQTHGSKNLLVLNRMNANETSAPSPFLAPALAAAVSRNNAQIRYVVTAIHELLGHASGKLLAETAPGAYNFDRAAAPVSPLTGEPVRTWYKLGETWTGVMGKFAASAEECRAMLVSYYLVDRPEVLRVLGVEENQEECRWRRLEVVLLDLLG